MIDTYPLGGRTPLPLLSGEPLQKSGSVKRLEIQSDSMLWPKQKRDLVQLSVDCRCRWRHPPPSSYKQALRNHKNNQFLTLLEKT